MATTTLRRFMDKVEINASTECWEWQAFRNPFGHGMFRLGDRVHLAHRVLYEKLRGPVKDGLELDHLCRNPACVNPDHLEEVTHRENILRGVGPTAQNARKTHCPQGHEYNNENTRFYGKVGGRQCIICSRARDALRRKN